MPQLKTRKPTGVVPWPLILLEGGEKSGKSWTAAAFTADERLGQTYWLDLGEGAADEYAAIPGASYLVLEHDGTWAEIMDRVEAVHAEATRAAAAKEKPIVLVIDSMTAEWDMLKDWAGARARESKAGKRILARDPNAEVKPANNIWNDVNTRHHKLMRLLMTFPGIAIVTARGKEVAVIGPDGNPIPGEKSWRVEAQKGLGYDVSAWVRLSREDPPTIIGVRSVHAGMRPGVDRPRKVPDFTLSWLIFDVLKCDPARAVVRDLPELDTTAPPVPDHGDYGDSPDGTYDQTGHAAATAPRAQTRPPRQQGGMAGLANQLDPNAAYDKFIEKVEAATDKDVLRDLYRNPPSVLSPDLVAKAKDIIMARADRLRLTDTPAKAGQAEQSQGDAIDQPAPAGPVGEQQAIDVGSADELADAATS
ncbi:Uncharacterised protein [Mycobacteroides abscessus subsp. abscessus]|nr:Uncharacterised protein [Mycobacteroides abscessus subsp. abscessus]